ncbi:MAG: PAS domain S-box protein [Desulfobulbaceae bacterium]|nr:PAS domain S-box protein [Desulfobulbaceae bacterium]
MAQDITARKQADEALRESEARFKALHNASFGGICIHDQGIILDCNQGLAEISGYSSEELIGMNGLLLIAEKTRDMVMKHILAGHEKPYEAVGVRKNNEEYPLRLEARNIPYKGKNVRTVEFRDITALKDDEAEREKLQGQLVQAQKMESVGRLAGGIAHDFNNMLGVILGRTEMAQEDLDPSQTLYTDLEDIRKAAIRSANLTRQLLAFARKQTIAPQILDFNDAVASMLKMVQRLLGEDIDLVWLPKANLWPVKIDPSQLDQILANLCVNARDAIPDVGKITIETENTTFDQAYCASHQGFIPGDFVQLALSDNGCGMDKDSLPHIFEPFFTTKETGKGTGLGLATVYGIVKQNNGFINVYSEPGQGTTFKIYLPRHSAEAALASESDPAPLEKRGDETILLVEDESGILAMTTIMLERLGYTVLPANSPGEALRLAESFAGAISLLLTDVVMPGMNGRDLAKQIMGLHPDIKTLFMSGYTANVIAHHGVLDKGVQFIEKPFAKKDLAAKIRNVLRQDFY